MTIVFDKSSALAGTDDGNGNSNINLRQWIDSITLSPATGTQIRVTVLFGTVEGTETPAIDEMWVGQEASSGHPYDFNGNQVRVTFSGGNTVNGSSAGSVTSDFVTLGEPYDNTKSYIIAFHVKSGASCNLSIAAAANNNVYFDGGGASNAATSIVTLANVAAGNIAFISKLEIQAAGGAVATLGRNSPRIFLPGQGPDRGMRSPKAFPAFNSYTLTAAQGIFNLSGIAAQFSAVPNPVGLTPPRIFRPGQGPDKGMRAKPAFPASSPSYTLSAAAGSFTVNGVAAQFSVVPNPVGQTPPRIFRPGSGPDRGMRARPAYPVFAGTTAYTLTAAQGAFVVSGIAAALNSSRSLTAAQGTFTMSGIAAALNRGITITAAPGAFTVNGIAASFPVGRTMAAAQGSFAVNGIAAGLFRGRTMVAAQGTFTLNGVSASFPVALSLLAAKGAFTVNGQPVVLTYTPAGGGASLPHSNPFFSPPGALTSLP